MGTIENAIAPTLQTAAAEIAEFLTQIAQRQRMEDSNEYSDNPEEAAQMEAEINATHVEGSAEGMTVKFELKTSGSEYDTVSTEGKPESYSGGSGGMVTYPDGHTEPSNVPWQLQGQPVPDSAEPASMWQSNYHTIASSLAAQELESYISAHAGEAIAPAVAEELSKQLGGGS